MSDDINDVLSSRESTPVIQQCGDPIRPRSKPRIFQKFMRENSFGKLKNEEKNLGANFVGVSVETQTDWSYLEDIDLVNNLKKHLAVSEWKVLMGKISKSKNKEKEEEEEVISGGEVSEYESEIEELESPKPKIENIGPPKILQFKPEIKEVIDITPPTPTFSIPEVEPIENVNQFMFGFNVHIKGGRKCEFCDEISKPWPSIVEQEDNNPEELYCCNDYQEYVDGLIKYQEEKERILNSSGNENSSSVKVNNPKAKKLVKERDEHKNMQKLLEKQKRLEEQAAKKAEQLLLKRQEKETSRNANLNTPSRAKVDNSIQTNSNLANQMKSINYQLSNLKCLQDGWTVRPRSRIKYNEDDSDEDSDDDINFLTTSNKNLNKNQSDNLTFKRTNFEFDKRVFDKPLIIKTYKDGKNCLLLFPDGSGNVFYPSSNLALSIILVSPGMHIITAYSDDQGSPIQIAQFDPYGNGSCNYQNGKPRLILSKNGGLELDTEGQKKKRWNWSEIHENHVHAPPFQSISYTLNHQICVKLVSQDKINVDFIAEGQICKFRINMKPKVLILSKNDALTSSLIKNDTAESYLKRKKGRIEELFKLMNNEDSSILKLPKILGAIANDVTHSRLQLDIIKNKSNKNLKPRKQSNTFVIA